LDKEAQCEGRMTSNSSFKKTCRMTGNFNGRLLSTKRKKGFDREERRTCLRRRREKKTKVEEKGGCAGRGFQQLMEALEAARGNSLSEKKRIFLLGWGVGVWFWGGRLKGKAQKKGGKEKWTSR